MSKLKEILFDFDGVLVDSLHIKTDAFSEMYRSYGVEAMQWVRQHHLENGGVSRFEKFKLYHQRFTGQLPTELQLQDLLDEFASRVKNAVIQCPEVSGAEAFLKKYASKLKLYIITGTPTEEIVEILEGRGWLQYFQGVMGSPQKKTHWVAELQQAGKANPMQTIFVGDATADYEASISGKMPFFLREHEENVVLFEQVECTRFKDFVEFEKELIQQGLVER